MVPISLGCAPKSTDLRNHLILTSETESCGGSGNERATYGEQIVATLWRQLSWPHFRELLPLAKPHSAGVLRRDVPYRGVEVRTLHEKIESMLYERTALSKQPDELVKQELAVLRSRGDVTPVMMLKEPYILDFLGLADRFLERDLEDAILRELETFLLEMGSAFSFVAR